MPKVRDSSGTIGTMRLPMFLSRNRWFSTRTKAMVVEISRPCVDCNCCSKAVERRNYQRLRLAAARRQIAAERLPRFMQVIVFLGCPPGT